MRLFVFQWMICLQIYEAKIYPGRLKNDDICQFYPKNTPKLLTLREPTFLKGLREGVEMLKSQKVFRAEVSR